MSAAHYGTTACLRSFAQVRKSLLAASLALSGQIQLDAFEDEFGRFRVWAANVGALQKGHSSLDYRLREAPLVRDNVQKLLKELHECLQEINVVLTGTRLPFDRQQRPTTPESNKSSSSEDDSSSEVSSIPETRMSELEQRFLTIVDIVDNLYKFSRMVRMRALHTRFLRAASYKKVDRETGIDLIAQFKTADYEYVKEAFLSFRRENGIPSLEISLEDAHLIKRFASAITKRRQQFLYWKRHRDKLGIHVRTEDFEVSTVIAPETSIPVKEPATDVQAPALPPRADLNMQVTINPPVPQSSVGKTDLTATTATVFIPTDNLSDTAQTTTSFATTARGLDGTKIELPALPKSAVPGKDFECQYCFAIVPSRYQSLRGWRAHVMRDLKPYICTYPGCSQSDLLFSSRHEWLEHEGWEHRTKYTCPEHDSQLFHTAQGFQIHLEENHHNISSELSFDALADISKSSESDARTVCPICLALLDNPDQLHNHIANHLERFAAFALPRDVETVDDDEMSKGSKNSSGGSSNETEASVDPESLPIAERLKIMRRMMDLLYDFRDSLNAAISPANLKLPSIPQTTRSSIDRFTKEHVEPFAKALSTFQMYPDKNIEAGELREPLNDAVRCFPRLQNLMTSFRPEDFLDEPQRVEDLVEPLDREHKIISQLLNVVRRLFPQTQAVRALFDFPANEIDELAFRKGDLMAVIEAVHRDWWRCSLRGKTGIIPLNYVEKLASPTAEVLNCEAKLEQTVFSGIKDVERLLFLVGDHIEGTEMSREEQETYHSVLSTRPALIELIGTYSQRKDDLTSLNEKFIRARRGYEELLEGSMAEPPMLSFSDPVNNTYRLAASQLSSGPPIGSPYYHVGDYQRANSPLRDVDDPLRIESSRSYHSITPESPPLPQVGGSADPAPKYESGAAVPDILSPRARRAIPQRNYENLSLDDGRERRLSGPPVTTRGFDRIPHNDEADE